MSFSEFELFWAISHFWRTARIFQALKPPLPAFCFIFQTQMPAKQCRKMAWGKCQPPSNLCTHLVLRIAVRQLSKALMSLTVTSAKTPWQRMLLEAWSHNVCAACAWRLWVWNRASFIFPHTQLGICPELYNILGSVALDEPRHKWGTRDVPVHSSWFKQVQCTPVQY